MHSAHSQSASPCGYTDVSVKVPLERNQLTQPLLLFLLATGFLLGISRRCLVCASSFVLRSCLAARLRRRIGLLYLIHLRWSWLRRCSLHRSGIRGARRFFIRVRRSRSRAHGLHSNTVAGRHAADLLSQVIADSRRARYRFFLQIGLAYLGG